LNSGSPLSATLIRITKEPFLHVYISKDVGGKKKKSFEVLLYTKIKQEKKKKRNGSMHLVIINNQSYSCLVIIFRVAIPTERE
jgi:hypothetical protein